MPNPRGRIPADQLGFGVVYEDDYVRATHTRKGRVRLDCKLTSDQIFLDIDALIDIGLAAAADLEAHNA